MGQKNGGEIQNFFAIIAQKTKLFSELARHKKLQIQ